jgi:hypothetical protein
VSRSVDVDGRIVFAIAPCPEDVVSKLARLAVKDKEFIAAFHEARPLDPKLIEDRINVTNLDPGISERAIDYIRRISKPTSPTSVEGGPS